MMELISYIACGALGGLGANWLMRRLYDGFDPKAFLRAADKADVCVVLVLVKHNQGKTGLLSNFASRFPELDTRAAILDTLRLAVHIAKGEIAPAQPGEDSCR